MTAQLFALLKYYIVVCDISLWYKYDTFSPKQTSCNNKNQKNKMADLEKQNKTEAC